MFDLSAPNEAPSTEPSSPGGSRNGSTGTIVALVLGLIVVIIGLSVFSSDDDTADPPPSSTTSTSRPPRTTEGPRPAPSPLLDETVIFEPDLGLAMVVFRSDGQVLVVDLATGAQQAVEQQSVAPIQMARWMGGTFVAMDSDGALWRLETDGSDSWHRLEVPGAHLELGWSGSSSLLGAWFRDGRSSPGYAWLEPDGSLELIQGPEGVDLSHVIPMDRVDGHLLFNSSDGVFVLGPDGQIRRLAYGTVVGVGGNFVARRECDDTMVCRLLLHEMVDGELRGGSPLDVSDLSVSDGNLWVRPAPDGRHVALLTFRGFGSELRIVPVGEGEALSVTPVVVEDPSMVTWVDSGDALVWWNQSGPMLHAVRVRGDWVTSELVSVEVRLPTPGRVPHAGVLLVPLAELPPGWAPSPP